MNTALVTGRPRTLITGGFGFIATWTAAGLLHGGHEVTLVDKRAIEGSPADLAGLPALAGISTARADITRPGSLDHLGEFDYIVHAAAMLGVTAVRSQPRETLRINIDGTAAVLDFARRSRGVRRFLLLSSSEVYGNGINLAEEDWLSLRTGDPRWSYAISKTAAEALVYAHGVEHGLPFVIVRPFNVYGPLRTGGYAIGALGRQALAGTPITVHGDGEQTRAWCHVEDFVNGLIRCLHLPEAAGEAFNIGDERNVLTMTRLAEMIRDLTGSGALITHTPCTAPDIELRSPSLGKARTVLGYAPARSLREGLRETLDWLARPMWSCPVRFRNDSWAAPHLTPFRTADLELAR